ncbi:3-oxo-5-alpha-steroid 4-dehydrogenase-domain-containing protein [Schizophyllum amplum]|uniref:3-oxo-5-alpha-steroid 4-dehydrogenase-domain-containing protein n=1 Tax=Schizophyllum amplum TaxID=97359 RepID=A0A550CIW9_9AGAR|nr:3-oxo-5-alpha-steroid 4-dehydrogenase-domain-containing protein [Auriculariopsis ampla]
MVSVTINPAGRPPAFARGLPVTVDVPDNGTVADIKAAIRAKFPQFHLSRQKLSVPSDKKAIVDETRVQDLFADASAGELVVKDLGPQISWRTVFLIEYVGPLLIHPVFYYYPRLCYGQDVQHSSMQTYVFALVMGHFVKRELETMFVHRFSHATMPFFNVFKNSGHYHILSGLLLALDVYRPKYSAPAVAGTLMENSTFLNVCAGLVVAFELCNLNAHMVLRSLRPAGTTKRGIPYGFGFGLVSCPNYLFETLAWTTISVMTGGSPASILFLVVATAQMAAWAMKKHKMYKKEFGKSYPRGRKAMFPFIF